MGPCKALWLALSCTPKGLPCLCRPCLSASQVQGEKWSYQEARAQGQEGRVGQSEMEPSAASFCSSLRLPQAQAALLGRQACWELVIRELANTPPGEQC